MQKGRKLVEKLHAAQEELRALEAQLQARDESLAQAHLNAQHAAEMRDTCVRQQAHIQQLQTTVEDLVTSGATLAKVCCLRLGCFPEGRRLGGGSSLAGVAEGGCL